MNTPVYPPIPEARDVNGPVLVDLCGPWAYQQPIRDRLARAPLASDLTLNVPGEVVMQGLPYAPTEPVALERIVSVPAEWAGQTLRLRFEAVYSACTLWIDGVAAGAHIGGFTPFDLDVTDFAQPGSKMRLTLFVENASIADLVGFATRYADHPLIGIPRKAMLYALPGAHLRALSVATLFEGGDYGRATLRLDLEASEAGAVTVALRAPDGGQRDLGARDIREGASVLDYAVDAPQLWDTESPALHDLTVRFGQNTYCRAIGFREIAVRDRKVMLNGQPILLRGVNHHETHPLTGRADTARWAETDVRLFREAHVNYLRASHYPPTIELVEVCDRLGMLLEVEAPVCFAFGQFDYMPEWDDLPAQTQEAAAGHIRQASLEMAAFYRSHPSVAIWSVANESHWAPAFAEAAAAIRAADDTRPLTFNWWKLGPECRDHVEIANHHYPEAGKVAEFETEPRPILFDEFAHLFCYNDRELATDPGLRHLWGGFLERQWEEIVALPNGAGGAIWAAIDDYFAVPQPGGGHAWHGYGEWGPLDGWRRKKPEYEEMARVFDPVKVRLPALVPGEPVTVHLENRFDFARFEELSVSWRLGAEVGSATLAGGPGSTAALDLPAPVAGSALELDFALPRIGYRRRVVAQCPPPEAPSDAAPVDPLTDVEGVSLGPWVIVTSESRLTLRHRNGPEAEVTLALIPRQVSRLQGVKTESVSGPLESVAGGWQALEAEPSGGALRVTARCAIAEGAMIFAADERGRLSLDYSFRMTAEFEPFQTGIELRLPLEMTELAWQSGGARADFPDDHPARGAGQASARRAGDWPEANGHPLEPAWPWALDETAQGTNDFSSTKREVRAVSLSAPGGAGLSLIPAKPADARAQMREDAVSFFLFDFTSHGSERFLASFAPQVTLKPGDAIEGGFGIVLDHDGGKQTP